MHREQQKDKNNKVILAGIGIETTFTIAYLNTELGKYAKHFARLENHNGVLYRKLFSDIGLDFIRQYVVPLTYVRTSLSSTK